MQNVSWSSTDTTRAIFIVLIIAGVVAFGAYEYANNLGSYSGYIGGYNADSIRWQASLTNAEKSYVGLLQQALDKMADVSQNKSVKVPTAGFDTLASIFNFSSKASDAGIQNQRLCNQTAAIYFSNTGIATGHLNITIAHQNVCKEYPILANDFLATPSADVLRSLSAHFTDLVFRLMKLDNTIAEDP